MNRDSLVGLASLPQGIAEVAQRRREVRFQRDRRAVRGDGVVELAELAQGIAEIAVRFGEVRLQRDRLADEIGGKFVRPHLKRHDSEQMQRTGVFGLEFEDTPIMLFGLGQATGLMVLDAELQ